MAQMGKWNGHVFEVSPHYVMGFTELKIKACSETEDKEEGGEKYVSRKNGKPTEISLSAHLNAQLGCDVRKEALKFIDEAHEGASDYLYIAKKKPIPCKLMLTDANVEEITITQKGIWTNCVVKLTMKQCSKSDGKEKEEKSSGGGDGLKSYTVQIPGMSAVKVRAKDEQAAITKAMGSNWSGTVYVNGTTYQVKKGVIQKDNPVAKTLESAGNVINALSGAVETSANAFWDMLFNRANQVPKDGKAATKTATNNPTPTPVKPAKTSQIISPD